MAPDRARALGWLVLLVAVLGLAVAVVAGLMVLTALWATP